MPESQDRIGRQTPLPGSTRNVLARLHARAWGVAVGLLSGFGLFAATLVLVARGGADAGQHLRLLGVFFPGYSVTIGGAFIGFVYAFVLGYAFGRLVGSAYNFFLRS